MGNHSFFLWNISRRETGIIRNAKRVRSRLSVRIKERKLPIAAPIMPDITAKGTIRHSISLFLACIITENNATGKKNRRFTPWAAVCSSPPKIVSHIIRIKPPPSPIEAAIPVRKPMSIFIGAASLPPKSALLSRISCEAGCCRFYPEVLFRLPRLQDLRECRKRLF